MNRPTCETCPFWDRYDDQNFKSLGDCRRSPPVVMDEGEPDKFPTTSRTDWCGEHPQFSRWAAGQSVAECRHDGLVALGQNPTAKTPTPETPAH